MKLLKNCWSEVVHTHHVLRRYKSIADQMKREVFEVTENQYITTRSRIRDLMDEKQTNSKHIAMLNIEILICQIKLPNFDDNQTDQEDFRDMCKAIFHDNKMMLLVKKMHYFKGAKQPGLLAEFR